MKAEELAMLSIAYEGNVDVESGQIKFPKTIPVWVQAMLDDYTKLEEGNDCYSAGIFLYANNKLMPDDKKLSKIINMMIYQKEYLMSLRYLIPEISIDYTNELEFLEFVHLFVENVSNENERMTEHVYRGGENALYKIFGVLTFITEWAKSKYSTDEESTIFECDERILPCEFTGHDIESIGIECINILPFPVQSFSRIEYIKVPFNNVFKSMKAWYDDSKEFRNEYIEFLRNETYLKDTSCNNENTGVLILDAVRAYLVKGNDFSSKRDEDTILAEIFTIFSNGKYKLFIQESAPDIMYLQYKFIPTTATHSFASFNGCFSELRILINHSAYWYIDINGNICTRDVTTVDTENIIVESDDVNAVENCIKFLKMSFSKTPLRMINMVLETQLSMRKVTKEHSTISYITQTTTYKIVWITRMNSLIGGGIFLMV